MRTCRCGRTLVRRPRMSDEQWARQRFCSRSCASRARIPPDPPLSPAARSYAASVDATLARRDSPTRAALLDAVIDGLSHCRVRVCAAPDCGAEFVPAPFSPHASEFCSRWCGKRTRRAAAQAA